MSSNTTTTATTSSNNPRYSDRDNVEDYRSRKREEDRKKRGDGGTSPQPSSSSNNTKKQDYELEREQRMARLRQEMKKEDEELIALDKNHQQDQGQHQKDENSYKPQEQIIQIEASELEGLDEEEQMKKLLGIDGFGTTKGKAVADNQTTAAKGVASKNKARKYRQYMNRKNGFNRPLDKID